MKLICSHSCTLLLSPCSRTGSAWRVRVVSCSSLSHLPPSAPSTPGLSLHCPSIVLLVFLFPDTGNSAFFLNYQGSLLLCMWPYQRSQAYKFLNSNCHILICFMFHQLDVNCPSYHSHLGSYTSPFLFRAHVCSIHKYWLDDCSRSSSLVYVVTDGHKQLHLVHTTSARRLSLLPCFHRSPGSDPRYLNSVI